MTTASERHPAPSEIEKTIRNFMSEALLISFGKDIQADTDLFETGLIDSFGFTELVAFLEGTFNVKLSDDELASVDTSTLSGITRMIVRHQLTKTL